MRVFKFDFLYFSILFVFLWSASSILGMDTVQVVSVVDGDTLHIRMNGSRESLRLVGIDAPESRDNPKLHRDSGGDPGRAETILEAGRRSTAFVYSVLKPGDWVGVELDSQGRDKYGRLLGTVILPDGRNLNQLLVETGHARRRYFKQKAAASSCEQRRFRSGVYP
jgi:micrococcal nuclease